MIIHNGSLFGSALIFMLVWDCSLYGVALMILVGVGVVSVVNIGVCLCRCICVHANISVTVVCAASLLFWHEISTFNCAAASLTL